MSAKPLQDRGERSALMEPMRISESSVSGSVQRGLLTDMALELATRSSAFQSRVPLGLRLPLANLVRAMNCYYSNLIEGHNTHPIDIERALKNDYSTDHKKRCLQKEAAAHIAVQTWIDQGDIQAPIASIKNICEIHQRFCELLPDELLQLIDPDTKEKVSVMPGQWRQRDVKVGLHIPVSAGAIPRLMQRFEEVYSSLSKTETLISAAAAHHRFLWIHPFIDGNGRVARLLSHAMLNQVLETGGLWSVARGLARQSQQYKAHLAACDLTRRNDLDGRGNLSEEALIDFTHFFLEACLDQVKFMENLMQPERLRQRILLWAEEEMRLGYLPAKSERVLAEILQRGELPRGEVPALLNMSERHARRVVAALMQKNVLTATSSRAPLQLMFPATLAGRWLPGLFPES